MIETDRLFAEVSELATSMGGALPLDPDPEPSPLTIDDFRRAIQGHIDSTAQQRSYDSGITCASYIGSTKTAWAAEAAALTAWRDDVWTYAYAEWAKVESGQRPQPTIDEFLTELPAIDWPEVAP